MAIQKLKITDTFSDLIERTNEIIDDIESQNLLGSSTPEPDSLVRSDQNAQIDEGWLPFSYVRQSGGEFTGTLDYTGGIGGILQIDSDTILTKKDQGEFTFGSISTLIISSGGYEDIIYDNVDYTTENIEIGSSNNLRIHTNTSAGWISQRTFNFSFQGDFTSPNNINQSNNITAGNDLSVGRNLIVYDDADIGGTLSLGTLSLAGNGSVQGDFTVDGNLQTSNHQTGDITQDTITLSGNADIGGSLDVSSQLNVQGNSTINGTLTLGQDASSPSHAVRNSQLTQQVNDLEAKDSQLESDKPDIEEIDIVLDNDITNSPTARLVKIGSTVTMICPYDEAFISWSYSVGGTNRARTTAGIIPSSYQPPDDIIFTQFVEDAADNRIVKITIDPVGQIVFANFTTSGNEITDIQKADFCQGFSASWVVV